MAEDNFTLAMFYKQWQTYQEQIKAAVAPLTAEQLALRAAPSLRSIGENAAHIIGCRIGWFTYTLGETASDDVKAWGDNEESARSTTELVQGLDASWQLVADCLGRWNNDDMQQTFPDDWEGQIVHLSRAWIVWHVLEHDLHHGGEISLTLGMYGLKSEFTS
jgi:uncharacterized damage-inducible protein DinB